MQKTDCSRCPALVACRSQIVFASPCRSGGLLAIGEAPGAKEDIAGEGFIGQAGKALDRLLMEQGIARTQYGRANICRCRPPENRAPTQLEIDSCIPFLAETIRECRPRVIIAVGGTPTSVLCGTGGLYRQIQRRREKQDWSGALSSEKAHPLLATTIADVPFIIPMPHSSPLALNRNAPDGKKWLAVAREQVALAVQLLQIPLPGI